MCCLSPMISSLIIFPSAPTGGFQLSKNNEIIHPIYTRGCFYGLCSSGQPRDHHGRISLQFSAPLKPGVSVRTLGLSPEAGPPRLRNASPIIRRPGDQPQSTSPPGPVLIRLWDPRQEIGKEHGILCCWKLGTPCESGLSPFSPGSGK